ncbi:hypothetical protein GCM10023189_40450 [Nibrella saemangeumensis]|uniref:Uncharacterized protein n=1 Tax=Nibrella saemangeumensis TaxID=1084526 RepID=A0ABP8NCH5_9BACT
MPLAIDKTCFLIEGQPQHQQQDVRLWVDGQELPLAPSLAVANHSPGGFEYGYAGSGPAQTALAICLFIFKEPFIARVLYQDFKRVFVARWPQGKPFHLEIDVTDFILENRERIEQAQEQETLYQQYLSESVEEEKTVSDSSAILVSEASPGSFVLSPSAEVHWLSFLGYKVHPSRCRIDLYRASQFAVLTDIGEGTSVTNEVETIAALVCQRFTLNPETMRFIEQYRHGNREQTTDWVKFESWKYISGTIQFYEPEWYPIPQPEFNAIIEEAEKIEVAAVFELLKTTVTIKGIVGGESNVNELWVNDTRLFSAYDSTIGLEFQWGGLQVGSLETARQICWYLFRHPATIERLTPLFLKHYVSTWPTQQLFTCELSLPEVVQRFTTVLEEAGFPLI